MEHRQRGLAFHGSDTSAKYAVWLVLAVLVAAAAVAVGRQMSTEAMAVVIGVFCGIAASIPTSLLLFAVFARRENQATLAEHQPRYGNRPPVVVVQGHEQRPGLPTGLETGYWPADKVGATTDRQFHIVGDESLTWNA